jgi:hypothetical protein
MNVLKLVIPALLLLATHPANAVLELRGHFGILQGTPTDLNTASSATIGNNDLNITSETLYGGDAIVKFPMSHIGLGVRYENLNQKKTTSNYGSPGANGSGTLSMTNWAALLTIRPIDSMVYFGFLGTYGFSQDLHYKTGLDSGTLADYKAGSSTVYSGGVEGGFKMGFLRLGAELGYESVTGSNMKNASTGGTTNDVKLAGPYGRIVVGLGL